MSTLKILLSGDWHLDSPWESLPAHKAAEMRRLARETPHRIACIAREEQADMILLSGDLFDSPNPGPESRAALERAFRDMDIPVFIAPGNHDYYTPGGIWDRLDLPENVHIFRSEALECIELSCACIYGSAFCAPYRHTLPENFAPLGGDKPHILLLHADLGGRGDYLPLAEEQLRRSGFSLAALGHIHKPSGLNKLGGTHWCYPGCPMGRGFDECAARGAMLITCTEGIWQGEFLELSDRRFEIVAVNVSGRDPHEALQQAVLAAGAGDIYRFELRGFARSCPSQAYLDTLAEAKGLYAAFLRDNTAQPPEDGEGTLRGTLMRLVHERAESEPHSADELARALNWALAALDGAEETEEVRK